MTDAALPWYQDGLRFKCTGCGKCCTGFPGYVFVTDKEIEKMAQLLEISEKTFRELYLRKVGARLSLKEDPNSFDCVFLKDKKLCQIYQARPTQCQTFPWWKENLKSQTDWEEVAKGCEGINHPDAPVIPLSQIEKEKERC